MIFQILQERALHVIFQLALFSNMFCDFFMELQWLCKRLTYIFICVNQTGVIMLSHADHRKFQSSDHVNRFSAAQAKQLVE